MNWSEPASVVEIDGILGKGYKPSAEYLFDLAAKYSRWKDVLEAAGKRIKELENVELSKYK